VLAVLALRDVADDTRREFHPYLGAAV
jgi:hypothetical protein